MGSGRITKKVGMSPCDTDAKQTLHEYVDQTGWSMRNGRHLDTSLVESSVAHAGSSRISGNSRSALRHLRKLGKRLHRARGTFPNCECVGVPSGAFVRLASVLFVRDSILE